MLPILTKSQDSETERFDLLYLLLAKESKIKGLGKCSLSKKGVFVISLADEIGRQDVELGMLQLRGVIKWPRGGTTAFLFHQY